MTENKSDWQPTGLERFSHLEDKIFRVAEAFKTVRKENEVLKAETTRLKEDLEQLQKNGVSVQETLGQLEREREELRDRVEKVLDMLAALDAR